MTEAQGFNASDVERAMSEIWKRAVKERPGSVVIDPETGLVLGSLARQDRMLRDLRSPAGLRSLFPGLPAKT